MWPFPFVSSQSPSVSLVRDHVLRLGWGRTLFIMDGALCEICVCLVGCTSLSLPLSFFLSDLISTADKNGFLQFLFSNIFIFLCPESGVCYFPAKRERCENIGCKVEMTFSSPYLNHNLQQFEQIRSAQLIKIVSIFNTQYG